MVSVVICTGFALVVFVFVVFVIIISMLPTFVPMLLHVVRQEVFVRVDDLYHKTLSVQAAPAICEESRYPFGIHASSKFDYDHQYSLNV